VEIITAHGPEGDEAEDGVDLVLADEQRTGMLGF